MSNFKLYKQEGKLRAKYEIIKAYGLETRVYTLNEKYGYGCAECCNGDRCDEDCDAKYKGRRKDCPHCKGEGWIPKNDEIVSSLKEYDIESDDWNEHPDGTEFQERELVFQTQWLSPGATEWIDCTESMHFYLTDDAKRIIARPKPSAKEKPDNSNQPEEKSAEDILKGVMNNTCTCHEMYKSRKKVDPDCIYCNYWDYVIDAMKEYRNQPNPQEGDQEKENKILRQKETIDLQDREIERLREALEKVKEVSGTYFITGSYEQREYKFDKITTQVFSIASEALSNNQIKE